MTSQTSCRSGRAGPCDQCRLETSRYQAYPAALPAAAPLTSERRRFAIKPSRPRGIGGGERKVTHSHCDNKMVGTAMPSSKSVLPSSSAEGSAGCSSQRYSRLVTMYYPSSSCSVVSTPSPGCCHLRKCYRRSPSRPGHPMTRSHEWPDRAAHFRQAKTLHSAISSA